MGRKNRGNNRRGGGNLPQPVAITDHEIARAHAVYLRSRVTIEARTPFVLATGDEEELVDDGYVTDAHGLPILPGTGLNGMLREAMEPHLKLDGEGSATPGVREVFGMTREDTNPATHAQQAAKDKNGARLGCSFGRIHDSQGRIVDGFDPSLDVDGDPVLSLAVRGIERDRVRINERGTAAHRGKFDVKLCPAGLRFTFDVRLDPLVGPRPRHDESAAAWERRRRQAVMRREQLWLAVLRFFNPDPAGVSPHQQRTAFRLGGNVHSGWGAFRVVSVHHGRFNLSSKADRDSWKKLGSRLDSGVVGLKPLPHIASDSDGGPDREPAYLELDLIPQTPWMTRAPQPEIKVEGEQKTEVAVPLKEPRVVWEGSRGAEEEAFVLPGTAIKGALAHRVAYWHRCLSAAFVDPKVDPIIEDEDSRDRQDAVKWLFGRALEHGRSDESSAAKPWQLGGPGLLIVEEAILDGAAQATVTYPHLRIDPFTGGTWPGLLFFDRPLQPKGQLRIRIEVEPSRKLLGVNGEEEPMPPHSWRALEMAVEDLREGRISLGMGGHGYGRFAGPPPTKHNWPTDDDWSAR